MEEYNDKDKYNNENINKKYNRFNDPTAAGFWTGSIVAPQRECTSETSTSSTEVLKFSCMRMYMFFVYVDTPAENTHPCLQRKFECFTL